MITLSYTTGESGTIVADKHNTSNKDKIEQGTWWKQLDTTKAYVNAKGLGFSIANYSDNPISIDVVGLSNALAEWTTIPVLPAGTALPGLFRELKTTSGGNFPAGLLIMAQ